MLSGNPTFAVVAILTLALGIAATSTVFTWVDWALLRPYAGARAGHELAVLEMVTPGAPNGGQRLSLPDFRDYRDHLTQISGVMAHRQAAFTVGDSTNSQLVWGELVTGEFFDVLGIEPTLGRTFTAEDRGDSVGASPVVVISDRLWRTRFRSDPAIAGKTVRVNRQVLTIIGVAPKGFHGSVSALAFDVWIPLTMSAQLGMEDVPALTNRGNRFLNATVRLKPGVTVEQAHQEAANLAATLAATYPKTNQTIGASVIPVWREHNGVAELLLQPLRILMTVSVLVLLIVCANVANLLLARSIAREKEFGIRAALGAGRGRVVRQMLTETLVLAFAGSVVAFPLMLWMQESLPALVPSIGLPVLSGYEYNGRIFWFTALVCFVSAMISGTAPALFSMRTDVNEVLKEGGRSNTSAASSNRMRGVLGASEMALAAIALVAAGLFIRSFQNLRSVNPGFDSAHVLYGRFFIESANYSGEQILDFTSRLRERLRGTPGLGEVGYSDFTPLAGTAGPYATVGIDGYTPATGEAMTVNRALVSPGYFEAMRIPLLDGRDFTENDGAKAPRVMIVNEAFARRYYGGSNPVGHRVRAYARDYTIVGLVRNSKYFSPAEAPLPFFYTAMKQRYRGSAELYLFLRTSGDPAQAIPMLRRSVLQTDPNAAAFHPVPLAEYTQIALFPQKLAASMMGGLGAMCVVLAAVGLFSVMSYAVTQRAHEIGIRMAMGADPGKVIGMVVRQGMGLAGVGMAVGTVAALGVTRLVSGMLFEVSAFDFRTFAGAAAFLAAVALVATWIPARSATRLDPMAALRR